jgi:hypothetical protein
MNNEEKRQSSQYAWTGERWQFVPERIFEEGGDEISF